MTSLDLRVYIEDTDAGGIVYHANYLNYLERGRTEWLRDKGFDQHSLFERNIALVVRRLECQYRLPARLDDYVTVETRAGAPRQYTVAFEQQIMRHGKLLFRGMVDIACIDATGYKPARWPEDLLSAMTLDSQNA
ncbi:acyl-CoA thioester hydrolase [Kushneria avicenniae]|uniref:Acyl-CoA thioester hydrolase n=1 Tax=Kushneria avicenniae TaxID=402385 RepID=A0A1I1FNT0_9GAMM|nr:tol-pal system-associated acyl-CoA thioesterase [Kushneria avicenniae]SFB98680.1 acyl-CoA thioester hydrolase [Kushneria avicenniae]